MFIFLNILLTTLMMVVMKTDTPAF